MRTLQILWALGPFVISFFRDVRRWVWWGAPKPRTYAFQEKRARSLVTAIAGLGPTFVKLAQVFASRADLINEPYLSELSKLVDAVPPFPFEEVDRIIRAEYGAGQHVDTLFERFDRVPVAAASLGQVHRARYRGRDVAVKVLRPGIEKIVIADLASARLILNWAIKQWPKPHVIALLPVVEEFEARIGEEMDFRFEAEFCEEIGANFKDNRDVIVPNVVHEMTRQRVLVLDFIEGTRIDKLDPARVNVKRLVQTLVEIYIQMMLVDGLFHADPHPGNLMVAADGRLVLLDFGMVVRVPIETRRNLIRAVYAAVRRDPKGVAEGFYKLGLVLPGTDESVMLRLAELLITNAFDKTTAQDRIDALLADKVMTTLFDFPIILPRDMVYFARTAALIEGIGTKYDPYFQAIPIASPVVLRMRTKILRSVGDAAKPSAAEIASVAGYALGKAARWVVDSVQNVRLSMRPSISIPRPTGKTTVKITTLATLAALTLGATQLEAQAMPTAEQQIAAAVLPLSKEMQAGATVMGYKTKGKLEVLRKGTNGMHCLALYVERPDFHVACYHESLEPFMLRGRQLRAEGVKAGAAVDSIRFAEIKSGKLKMPAQGALHTITAKKDDYDAATNKVKNAGLLTVLYVPGATAESIGISATPKEEGPWIMFPGTPKAHVMMAGKM
jgi:predicted unusual protein kinase regulating ubiquinone biosynthesis (AarF/ABC1/UbiB family)